MKRGWVIKEYRKGSFFISELYYSGYTYIFEDGCYGEFRDKKAEAKVYTTQKRAANAMEKLKLKVCNWDKLEVESLEEDE